MQALIDAEQPDDVLRARYVDRFNRGYESFRSVYLTCTPAATLAIDRYLFASTDYAIVVGPLGRHATGSARWHFRVSVLF